ncbi:hypothetical protein K469DRAFT_755201 [Zopfia rhizophila CBS 207.26]|uniref:AA1-like domain-containing protein n=1 Tax=Zopfia rhizophila CBS 207.26 TaxID=1314779 RepID=A0A6A6DIA3_9PEZI|nr:hypothetical protein K469DRAFT_755201 [Zopfia rhizophila CBS 207.26]
MRAVIATVAALAGASSAAVVPRADYGFWDVNVTRNSAANGWSSREISAKYFNSELSEPIPVHCNYSYWLGQDPVEQASCDDPSFSYDLQQYSISLKQTVNLWNTDVTVMGNSSLEFNCNSATGRYCTSSAQVDVTTAIA